MAKINLSISLDEGINQQLEDARGDVPRSTWVRRAILQRLANESNIIVGGLPTAPPGPVGTPAGLVKPDTKGPKRRTHSRTSRRKAA